MTLQRFHLAGTTWEAESDARAPLFLSGPHLYLIGTIGGVVVPFGEWHIQGKMGGAWAHPLRVLHGWSLGLAHGDGTAEALTAGACDLFAAHAVRHMQSGPITLTWTEFVPDEHPALLGLVALHNAGAEPWRGALELRAELDMRGCWFGGWETPELRIERAGAALCATGASAPFAGRAAAIDAGEQAEWHAEVGTARARIALTIAPGQQAHAVFALAES
jgi:hypothetical protein